VGWEREGEGNGEEEATEGREIWKWWIVPCHFFGFMGCHCLEGWEYRRLVIVVRRLKGDASCTKAKAGKAWPFV
jgi:hypothetical protein